MRSSDDNPWPIPCASFALFAAIAGLAAPSAAQPAITDLEVPFLTLRNVTGADDPGEFYGDERSVLSAGWCRVRELELGGLAPLAGAAPSFIREEFLRVDRIMATDSAAVLDDLQDTAGDDAPAIYVHGYYIGFEKGCRRAVLLQENAGLSGRFLWFSWPSDGAIAYYTHDEADLYWSVPDLAEAIIEAERRFGGGVVDVMGHSLGARGVVLALYDVANRAPGTRIDEVVLLAPDMDFAIFQRILPRILPIVENVTVYVTSGDRPLALSAQLHGYPRLGEAGNDVSTLAGVEVIDLSDLPSESPTGHLYHIYSDHVGDDLGRLLGEGRHAAERPNLLQAGPNLWRLQQAGAN
ncbi:alpha/beta hydrolase [Roseibacterium sp. SDUM158017]|uniref:alpha/beta hydrolase n=1 Tax=Roseicyclus salinarum TaxID=3036773 RepID=UPI0024153508|nr:alpha/beta hydrolase [Roseibacterium sp. SDUM158017]MDG4649462.1 alpha/beta hydrolase [Roseibacterium sp. SDUM158017]